MPRPDDPNDYERKQSEYLAYDGPSDSEDPLARELLDEELRAANRYGSFDLKYPARCDRCKRTLPPGVRVIGRKLEDRWIIEEMEPCPSAAPALNTPGDAALTQEEAAQATRATTDSRGLEEVERDRILEERAAPYSGRTLTDAERLDPEVTEILDRARGAMERRLGLPPGVHELAYMERLEREKRTGG